MRVGVPMWNGRISPVFDTAGYLLVVDIEDGQATGRNEETLNEALWPLRVRRLVNLGVGIMICGGVSPGLAAMITASGIRLIPGVAGDVDEVLKAFCSGHLPSPQFFMPGWACGRRGRGGRHGRFRGRR